MAEYFLPDLNLLKELHCAYELRILTSKDFTDLYTDDWSNALCADRKELDYRRQGIASALISKLAIEILKRDKVPFYCCAWCNIKSAKNAIKCGFKPAWVEMTVKSVKTVDDMNK